MESLGKCLCESRRSTRGEDAVTNACDGGRHCDFQSTPARAPWASAPSPERATGQGLFCQRAACSRLMPESFYYIVACRLPPWVWTVLLKE